MRKIILILCALSLNSPAILFGQLPADSPAASTDIQPLLDRCAWIAGHWQGEALGGKFEETWNPPLGPGMMGMFKLIKDGEVQFYELMTIVPQDGNLVLRIKHFDQKLVGWEEKDKSAEFPLLSATDTEIKFEGLSFRKQGKGKMQILVLSSEDTSTEKLVFNCQLAQPSQSISPGHAKQ